MMLGKSVKSLVKLSLVAVGVCALFGCSRSEKPKKVPEVRVSLSAVKVANVPITASAAGNLIANQKADISPKVGGYITSVDFVEGEYVKAGTVLVTLDDSSQKQGYVSAKAAAQLSMTTYDRYLQLRKHQFISPQDIEQYKVDADKANATLITSKKALSDMTLRAPFGGYVSAKSADVGDYVNVGQLIVSLYDTNHLKVKYSLPSYYAPKLHLGQPVTVTANFLPGKKIRGKVSYIAPNVDPSSQTIEVHATIDNHLQELKPGQYVNIAQTLGVKKHVLMVPQNAVIPSIKGYSVYEVKDNKVLLVDVKVGSRLFKDVEITHGLKPGDKVITKGQDQVKAGQIVKVIS